MDILKRFQFDADFDPSACPKVDLIDFANSIGPALDGFSGGTPAEHEIARGDVQKGAISDMFTGDFTAGLCADIFEDAIFRKLVSTLPTLSLTEARKTLRLGEDKPVSTLQARIASALVRSSWRFSGTYIDGVFGCTHPNSTSAGAFANADVTIYASSVDADEIHHLFTFGLSARVRTELVAAHEFAHVVDLMSGLAQSDPKSEETRATIFGSFLAQCVTRRSQFQAALGTVLFDPTSSNQDSSRLRQCTVRRWRELERAIVDLRKQWLARDWSIPDEYQAAYRCQNSGAALGATDGKLCP